MANVERMLMGVLLQWKTTATALRVFAASRAASWRAPWRNVVAPPRQDPVACVL